MFYSPAWSISLKVIDHELALFQTEVERANLSNDFAKKSKFEAKIFAKQVFMNDLITKCQAGAITPDSYFNFIKLKIQQEEQAIITFNNCGMPTRAKDCQVRIDLMKSELDENGIPQ